MEVGRNAHAEETARKAAAALAQLAAEGRREAISLRGALALRQALIAARTGDPAAADEQLGLARDMARLLGDAGHPSDAGFGRGQIAQYEAAVREVAIRAEADGRSRSADSPSPAENRQQAAADRPPQAAADRPPPATAGSYAP